MKKKEEDERSKEDKMEDPKLHLSDTKLSWHMHEMNEYILYSRDNLISVSIA